MIPPLRRGAVKPPPEPQNLSLFAQKYGRITDDPEEKFLHRYLYSKGKSGYTPTDTIFTVNAEVDPKADWHNKEVEHHQKALFYGFTAREFFELGVYSDLNQKEIELTNPIHPLLDRSLWESTSNPDRLNRTPLDIRCHGPAYSHLQRYKGRWLADNPIVWEILEPVLRLASRLVYAAASTPFVDAFLCGQFKPIPAYLDTRSDDAKVAHGPLQAFYRRDPQLIGNQDAQNAFAYFVNLFRQKGQWGISEGGLDPQNRTRPLFAYWGVTIPDYSGSNAKDPARGVTIQICTQLLMPLLRNDLPVGEKMGLRFMAAEGIMHEIMHAMNTLLVGTPEFPQLVRTEPYFEDNIFAELGYAYTKDTVGGMINSLRRHNPMDPQSSIPGFSIRNVPNTHTTWTQSTVTNQSTILGGTGAVSTLVVYKPVHNSWYHLIHNEAFWTVGVPKYGVSLLRPRTAGTTITHTHTWQVGQGEAYRNKSMKTEKHVRDFFPDVWKQIRSQLPETLELWSLTPVELLAVQLQRDMAVEENKAGQLEIYYNRMKTVAAEIRGLLKQVRTRQSLIEDDNLGDYDKTIVELYQQIWERVKNETVYLQIDLISLLKIGERVNWESAIGLWYFDFLVKTNRRLRQVMHEILEWVVDRRSKKIETLGVLFAAASFLGGLLCTQRDFLKASSGPVGIDFQQSKQVMEDELEKFNQALLGDRNANTARRATWDELYTPMDIEDERKLKEECLDRARKLTSDPDQLVGVLSAGDDLDNLFKNTGFELCCQIDDSQHTSHGLNQIAGQILLYRNREVDHARELRALQKELIQVRARLNLPPFSFKTFGLAAWGNDVSADEMFRRNIDVTTGRGPVPDHERQLQLDCEQWSDALEVMIYNSLNPGQKRDVGKWLTRGQAGEIVEQGRSKRMREDMIFEM